MLWVYLQLLFETFWAPINVQGVTFKIRPKPDIGLSLQVPTIVVW
jgi:hypothetical protein